MAGEIVNSTSDIVRNAVSATVYTRSRWMYQWEEQPRMRALTARFGCSPAGSSAVFEIDCGAERTIDQPGILQHMEPLDILGHYVKVEVVFEPYVDSAGTTVTPAPVSWYGIIAEDGGVRHGSKEYAVGSSSVAVLTRVQAVQAVGLEILFDNVVLDRSYTLSTSLGGLTAQVRIPIPFNAPHNYAGDGNRSASVDGDTGAYVFTDDLANGHAWSTRNIAEYLVEYFQPIDWLGTIHLPCALNVNARATLPTWDKPYMEYAGATLRDVLNQLCDFRHNLGWQILVDEDVDPGENHKLTIDVFSFSPTALTLPSGAEIAENFNQVQLDFDRALDVTATLTASIRHKVDQVVVRGARRRSCFSLSCDDGTLAGDWTSFAEAYYKAGPDFLPSNAAEQERAVIEYRRQDSLRQVYAYFRVPADWDFEVGDGLGGAASSGSSSGGDGKLPIDPFLNDVLAWGYLPTLRFLPALFPGLSSTTPTGSAQEPPRPFGVIEIEDGSYRLLDQLAETAGLLDRGEGKGRKWSASLAMRSDMAGVIVQVSGAQQLVLAGADFPTSESTAYELAPQLDYHDMIVTVACETFGYVTAEYPDATEVDSLLVDQATKVYVDVGEAARLDYVVPGTVIGLDDGDLDRDESGGYVRDDRTWMQDLARYVYQWYGTPRQAFTFQMQQISPLLKVGQLITKIGSESLEEEVNAVVVSVTYDFVAQTTAVETSFANLDVDSLTTWFTTNARSIAKSRR